MGLKRLPEDFRDFLSFLNKNGVKYLLLGGWAVGIHGYPRATGDMDVLIATDETNLDRLLKALYEFGAPTIAVLPSRRLKIASIYIIIYIMKKKVSITLDDVLESLELGSPDVIQYLNTETGGIAMISDASDSFDENGEPIDRDDIDRFDDEKYIALPIVDSEEGYQDMEEFIGTVEDSALRNRLQNALNQKRPFRRFKDVLIGLTEEERWYKFKTERNRRRALEWLEDNNLEPVGQ